jgi:hypothetical protein
MPYQKYQGPPIVVRLQILIDAHIFAINLVNFLAPKLIQHVIAIASTLFFEIKYVRDKIIQVNNLKEG